MGQCLGTSLDWMCAEPKRPIVLAEYEPTKGRMQYFVREDYIPPPYVEMSRSNIN